MIKNIRARLFLSPAARQVLAKGLTYLSVTKMRRLERVIRELRRGGVRGDYAEFGVAAGGSAAIIAQAAVAAGSSFHGFDVFGMIPEPTSEHDDTHSKERFEEIRSGKAKGIGGNVYYGYVDDLEAKVRDTLAQFGLRVDDGRIHLHRGLFEDTLPETDIPVMALAHIDCDWYDPVKFCLDYAGPRIALGGVILLDDYNDYEGCRRATDEFLQLHPEFRLEPGRNVILRRIAPVGG